MCKGGLETEKTLQFLLRCRLYSTIRTELLDDIYTGASSVTNYPLSNTHKLPGLEEDQIEKWWRLFKTRLVVDDSTNGLTILLEG